MILTHILKANQKREKTPGQKNSTRKKKEYHEEHIFNAELYQRESFCFFSFYMKIHYQRNPMHQKATKFVARKLHDEVNPSNILLFLSFQMEIGLQRRYFKSSSLSIVFDRETKVKKLIDMPFVSYICFTW